ncbi:MAG: acyl-CoA dehydrogenase family protein [Candidatus Thermoplasmatota archaeon]|nr:acyl-CoA dehydrogenase family protein [Candidatus Thermoplasmatota archaeon]
MDLDRSKSEAEFLEHVRRVIKDRIAPEYPHGRERKTTPRRMFEIWGAEGLLGFTENEGEITQTPWLKNIHLYKELAAYSGGLGIATFVQGQLGNQALFLYANEEQREEYLRPGIKGERSFAFANTEPSAGSDASAIKMTAEDKGDHFLVNGMKAYITNADFADDIIFTAITDPSAEKKHRGISMFIIHGDTEGLTRTRLKKYGWKGSHLCTLRFENVKVPKEKMLGKPGRGFYQTMEIFNNGRIGVASLAFGAALGAYRHALVHARKRQAFGTSLFDHESKRNEFADKLAHLQAGWLLIQKAAFESDKGRDFKHFSSLAKHYNTEEGLQISLWGAITLGARGVIEQNPISEFPHDSLVSMIGEGAPEVQMKIISEHIDEILDGL